MVQEQYRCGECGESFTTRPALEEHYRIVHSFYTCEVCGERFGSAHELEEHNRERHPATQ